MRFWQKKFDPVRDHLLSTGSEILVLEWDREPVTGGIFFVPSTIKRRAARPPMRATIDEVARLARHADDPMQAGSVLRDYFHIGSSVVGRPLSLVEAVEHVESDGADGEFLLAGYPDGGLISLSRHRLPFQQNLDPITWWGP